MKQLSSLLKTLILATAFVAVPALAWEVVGGLPVGAPTETVPTGNFDLFLNTSDTAQFKPGSLGIGTAGDPTEKLEVNGNIKLSNGVGIYGSGRVQAFSLGDLIGYTLNSGTRVWDLISITSTTPDYFSIRDTTAGANRLTITDAGSVGIGTDAPGTYKLNVNGTSYLNGASTVNGTLGVTTGIQLASGAGGSENKYVSYYGAPTAGYFTQMQTTATAGYGTYGPVTSDWALYNRFNGASTRGWIWQLGTTNVAGLSGQGNFQVAGTITAPSIKLTTGAGANKVLTSDATGLASWVTPAGSGLTGSGTTNYLTKWTGATALGNSSIFDNGTSVGIGTTYTNGQLNFQANGTATLIGSSRSDGTQIGYIKSNGWGSFSTAGGGLAVGYDWPNSAQSGMIVNGSVGIGTATPGAYKLNVNGTTYFNGAATVIGALSASGGYNGTVGATTPASVVATTIKLTTGAGTAGKVLTSTDTLGNASWADPAVTAEADTLATVVARGATSATDITVNGVTVGRGAGGVATNTSVGSSALTSNNSTANSNTATGYSALYNNLAGSYNTAHGRSALWYNVAGSRATAIGSYAMLNANDSTTPFNSDSTAVGYEALKGGVIAAGNIGDSNTAVGFRALRDNTEGDFNVASGKYALLANNIGSWNTAVGGGALQTNQSGTFNTAVGYASGPTASGLSNTTAIGSGAIPATSNTIQLGNASVTTVNTSGQLVAPTIKLTTGAGLGKVLTSAADGVASWGSALPTATNTGETIRWNQTSGLWENSNVGDILVHGLTVGRGAGSNGFNVAVGFDSLDNNTSGYLNTAIGYASLYDNREGMDNTAVGNLALFTNYAGSNSTAIGSGAMKYANSATNPFTANNTAVGFEALKGGVGSSSNTGTENTAVGAQALVSNTDGYSNTAQGYWALKSNTTGDQNTANGVFALNSNVAGSGSTAIGYNAMVNANNTATPFNGYNTAVGYEALKGGVDASLNTGNLNTAVGYRSLSSNTTGSSNTANGRQALQNNASGTSNTAVGATSLYVNNTGSNNTATGVEALYNNTGSYNTAYGAYAFNGNASGSYNTAIGYATYVFYNNLVNATAIGNGAVVKASNTMQFGNGSVTDVYFGTHGCTAGVACGEGSLTSTNGVSGYAIAHAIRFNSTSDRRLKKDIRDTDLGLDFINKLEPVKYRFISGDQSINYGFIAQDVEKALDGRSTNMVTHENDEFALYELNYSSIIAPAVKAIQEVDVKLSALQEDVKELKSENDQLRADNAALLKRIEAIEVKLK